MWLNLIYFVTLMCISEGHLNKRLQHFYERLQQKKWVFSFGGVPDEYGPYSYLRSSPVPDDDPYFYLREQPDGRSQYYLREPTSLERRQPTKLNNKNSCKHKPYRTGAEYIKWLQSDQNLPDEWAKYTKPSNPTLDHTLFCPLLAKESGAVKVTDESEYPWLARVYHNEPQSKLATALICTAAAVAVRIFITAARCVQTAKVDYTTVELNTMRFGVDAFVYPINESKQIFDDIALIVASKDGGETFWETPPKLLELIDKPTRPDDDENYDWFQDWALQEATNTVVGFLAPEKRELSTKPTLYKLDKLYASNFLCNKILPIEADSNDYWVPCAHSCTPQQHLSGEDCPYLIGLGHIVLDKDGKLIGVVTWNCEHGVNLGSPVGMAVPNTAAYSLDLKCAQLLIKNEFEVDLAKLAREVCDEEVYSQQ